MNSQTCKILQVDNFLNGAEKERRLCIVLIVTDNLDEALKCVLGQALILQVRFQGIGTRFCQPYPYKSLLGGSTLSLQAFTVNQVDALRRSRDVVDFQHLSLQTRCFGCAHTCRAIETKQEAWQQ